MFSAFKRDCTQHKTDNEEVMLICQLMLMISLSVEREIARPNGRKKTSINECEETFVKKLT